VGKRTQSFVLGLSRQYLILIPLVLVLPRFVGIEGIWAAFPLADLLSTSLTVTLLIREVKRLRADGSTGDGTPTDAEAQAAEAQAALDLVEAPIS
jgi:Na+-driven multidrug efflux pump